VTMNLLDADVRLAVEAAQDKQALDISALDLRGSGAFADYFVLCSGSSGPQIQAIGEAVEERLHRNGRHVTHREGRGGGEWHLLDYGFLVVHIFSERARQYYDLERLWRNAERIDLKIDAEEGARTSRHGESESRPGPGALGGSAEPEGNAAR
jgi:ribosome-associated protein